MIRLPTNLLTKEGVRALAIVLGIIVIIAGIVYTTNFVKGRGVTVIPSKTFPTKIPTITPLIEQKATSSASPSSTRNIQRPTGAPTSGVKEATVSSTPQNEKASD